MRCNLRESFTSLAATLCATALILLAAPGRRSLRKCLPHFATLCIAAVLLFGGEAAFAQMRIVGAISGVVIDPSGAVVVNAKVTLQDEENGATKETVTNQSGQYLFPDLPFGTFQMKVVATG